MLENSKKNRVRANPVNHCTLYEYGTIPAVPQYQEYPRTSTVLDKRGEINFFSTQGLSPRGEKKVDFFPREMVLEVEHVQKKSRKLAPECAKVSFIPVCNKHLEIERKTLQKKMQT